MAPTDARRPSFQNTQMWESHARYDLESANMCEGTGLGQWPRLDHAQVVIFKKEVPEAVRRKRKWKLRALIKQEDQGTYESVHKQRGGEYEQFLQDVEQDAEMRARLNIYKDPQLWRLGEDGRVSDAAVISTTYHPTTLSFSRLVTGPASSMRCSLAGKCPPGARKQISHPSEIDGSTQLHVNRSWASISTSVSGDRCCARMLRTPRTMHV